MTVARKLNPMSQVVYNDVEISQMTKLLADITAVSIKGGFPQYEIKKLASIVNMGGETVENYIDRMKLA